MNFTKLVYTFAQTDRELKQVAFHAINLSVTIRNWLFGFYIVEFEQHGEDRAEYGKGLLQGLSKELQEQKLKAVSLRELRNYRRFYHTYPQIRRTLTSEFEKYSIWRSATSEFETKLNINNYNSQIKNENKTENLEIKGADIEILLKRISYSHFEELCKIDNNLKRVFYEIECIKGNWSVRELERQIGSLLFERTGLSKNKDKLIELANTNTIEFVPDDIIKDPYVFEFLGLKQQEIFTESDLEVALLNHLQSFLLELGKGFCFESRQKRITIDNKHYYVDLVFYHKILKCNVLIELKSRKFEYADAAQMTVYLNYYRKNEMQQDDNEPIGLLLCTDKGETLVEYAVTDKQLFVSKYQFALPSKEELKQFIQKELKDF